MPYCPKHDDNRDVGVWVGYEFLHVPDMLTSPEMTLLKDKALRLGYSVVSGRNVDDDEWSVVLINSSETALGNGVHAGGGRTEAEATFKAALDLIRTIERNAEKHSPNTGEGER